jgi:ketosteroid isomerase-like protein
MSQENVEIAKRLNTAINDGDAATVVELLHGDLEWWDRKDDPGATVHRGPDGFQNQLAELAEDIVDLRVEAKEYIPWRDYVIISVRVTGRGRTSDAAFEQDEVHVSRLRDGKVIELREYASKDEALKAVGLEE